MPEKNMLTVLDAVLLEGIIYLEHKLHLVVADALGLGSNIKADGMWAPYKPALCWTHTGN